MDLKAAIGIKLRGDPFYVQSHVLVSVCQYLVDLYLIIEDYIGANVERELAVRIITIPDNLCYGPF